MLIVDPIDKMCFALRIEILMCSKVRPYINTGIGGN